MEYSAQASMLSAIYASRSRQALNTSITRLSSGVRINRAADDASGLAIADRLDASAGSATVALRNVNDGISAAEVAEGATAEVSDMLGRMRELAVQASNGLVSAEGREAIQLEFSALQSEIDRIGNSTSFNGSALTAADTARDIQAGPTGGSISMSFKALPGIVPSSTSVATQADAQSAIDDIDSALETANAARASYGATTNRLSSAMRGLESYVVNTTASRSRIIDLDYALEFANFTSLQLQESAALATAGQSMQLSRSAFDLLR